MAKWSSRRTNHPRCRLRAQVWNRKTGGASRGICMFFGPEFVASYSVPAARRPLWLSVFRTHIHKSMQHELSIVNTHDENHLTPIRNWQRAPLSEGGKKHLGLGSTSHLSVRNPPTCSAWLLACHQLGEGRRGMGDDG